MELIPILFFFGLSAGTIGKIKGGSFFLWFLVGFALPFIGTLAALLYPQRARRCRGANAPNAATSWPSTTRSVAAAGAIWTTPTREKPLVPSAIRPA